MRPSTTTFPVTAGGGDPICRTEVHTARTRGGVEAAVATDPRMPIRMQAVRGGFNGGFSQAVAQQAKRRSSSHEAMKEPIPFQVGSSPLEWPSCMIQRDRGFGPRFRWPPFAVAGLRLPRDGPPGLPLAPVPNLPFDFPPARPPVFSPGCPVRVWLCFDLGRVFPPDLEDGFEDEPAPWWPPLPDGRPPDPPALKPVLLPDRALAAAVFASRAARAADRPPSDGIA